MNLETSNRVKNTIKMQSNDRKYKLQNKRTFKQ